MEFQCLTLQKSYHGEAASTGIIWILETPSTSTIAPKPHHMLHIRQDTWIPS